MIEMPRRSVTRFFIPLIDVLTLLFCIYLLLPVVEKRDDSATSTGAIMAEQRDLPLTESERRELERLRELGRETLDRRLWVRVLDIDAETGKLFYYGPERTELRTEAEARALIERQKRHAGAREVYFLFLYPRTLSGYPEERQMQRYRTWFADVAHGFDNPQAGR
jgi:hypothetical protein